MQVGASAYDWRTRQPTYWHPGPVRDAEAFCRRALDEAFNNWGMYLREDEYNDSLQELIVVLWRLEARYDPDRAKTFEQFAKWTIPQRAVDVGPRRVLGRHGNKLHNYMAQEFDGYSVASPVGRRVVDDPTDSLTHLERVLNERSSSIARKDTELGVDQDRTTTSRNQGRYK